MNTLPDNHAGSCALGSLERDRIRIERASLLFVLLCVAMLWTVTSKTHASPVGSVSPSTSENSHQSVFINDPTIGKDPFFPKSNRRAGMVRIDPVATVITNAVDRADPSFDHFTLKGISLSADKKLALINNYTFAEGEEQEVRVADQIIKVRCVTIQERSAVISIRGREKEITLREGL